MMTAKKGKDAIQHDDVSGLFARLGTPASQGYHDFAYTQLSPRTCGLTQAHAPAAVEPITVAPDAVQPPVGGGSADAELGNAGHRPGARACLATRRDRSRSGAGCARPAAQVASARRTGAARRAAGRSARADAVGALVPAPVAGRCAQLRAKPAQAPAFALTCCPLFPAAGAHALAACCAARRHA
ncbi:hypothetical protein XACLE20_1440039 [Xanthomonas citri pv. citri]|nr:hypothetical protein XACLE20_1440039 [Xanthomonas citri pv. citri]CEH51501.1 hypothetical protein XACLE3_6520003 [Xanthomonas citri pv. citri]